MPPISWALVRQGDSGPSVAAVQFLLRADGAGIDADGVFGPLTDGAVRAFQSQRGLAVDGIVGDETWPALIVQVSQGATGDAVRAAQVLLATVAVDGIFGPETEHRVKQVQFQFGLSPDGIVGPQTWLVLTSLVPVAAAEAIIEPDSVAGIGLGANKSEAHAVLGTATSSGKHTDVNGEEYDFLHWQLDGQRGLTLNYRFPTGVSPKLTDWQASASGPRTVTGVEVGDSAGEVVAAYGPLEPFVGIEIAAVEQGGGRMIVVVDNGAVTLIIGGDPAFWMRSIAT